MGLTNFVERHLLHGRSRNSAASDPHPPAASAPAPASPASPASPHGHTPRRRRIHAHNHDPRHSHRPSERPDRGRDRDRDRLRASSHLHSSHFASFAADPHDAPPPPPPPDWSEKHLHPDPLAHPPPPDPAPRSRRTGWRRPRPAGRVKSNLDDSFAIREPPTPTRFRDFQPPPAPHHHTPHYIHSQARVHTQRAHGASRDPAVGGSPSLKKLLAAQRDSQQQPSPQGKGRSMLTTFSTRDAPRRAHYHRSNNRIRSNLDQFMRKDKETIPDRRMSHLPAPRRRHSMLNDRGLQPQTPEPEPISLMNELLRVGQDSFSREEADPLSGRRRQPPPAPPPSPLPKRYNPPAERSNPTINSPRNTVPAGVTSPVPESSHANVSSAASPSASSTSTASTPSATSPVRQSSTPPSSAVSSKTPPLPASNPVAKPSSSSVPESVTESSVESAGNTDSQSSRGAPPKPSLTPLAARHLAGDFAADEPRSMRKRFDEMVSFAPPNRISADASFPARPRQTVNSAFARSQSNPTPTTHPRALPKRAQRRPPPLRTPNNDATGFACGVGGTSSGMRPVALGSAALALGDPNKKALRRTSGRVTADIMQGGSGGHTDAKRSVSVVEIDDLSDPKAEKRFDVWGGDQSKDGSSGGSFSRFSRKPTDKEKDLFLFEEASQSSFGDTESPSRVAAKNGIVPIERQRDLAEVTEDHFVFGADGSFSDGGFIISSNGLVEAPDRVMRKKSDGLAVDGVPTSSNNLIFVKSLDEFRKSFTFKAKSEDGPSTLGRGAAGRVYLANHEPTGRKIAVKEINVYDDDKRSQLKKELQTLISHESRFLVRSFGAFYDGAGVVHVTLEYMDRGALSQIVRQRGRIPEPVMCKIAEHCLRGLSFLHENHVLHRDVKTGNILLSRKLCRAKLSDFGLARDLEKGSSLVDTFVGTVAYMSPERLLGSEYTYASDIWGLGISILECAMGKYPFPKPQSYFDILDAAQSNPCSLVQNEVSKELVDFIQRCTFIDPNKRPKAAELLEHDWIKSQRDNTNALREWLDTIPKLHCADTKVSSELAFYRQEKAKAKILRAKAQEACL